jgi:hypothetical protein
VGVAVGDIPGVGMIVRVAVGLAVGVPVGVTGVTVAVAVRRGDAKANPLQPVNENAENNTITKLRNFMVLSLRKKNAENEFYPDPR